MQVLTIELENLGTINKNLVRIQTATGYIKLWFSYKTIVGFETENRKVYCTKNYWGTTTGKLLNEIEPDKDARLDDESFRKHLDKTLER